MAEPAYTDAQPIEMSREEFLRLLEPRILRDLGLSLDEFMERLDAGELPDTSVAMGYAMLIGERPR